MIKNNINASISLNQAFEAGKMTRDNLKRPAIMVSDKYAVKVKDLKGNDYEIRYFF